MLGIELLGQLKTVCVKARLILCSLKMKIVTLLFMRWPIVTIHWCKFSQCRLNCENREKFSILKWEKDVVAENICSAACISDADY